MARLILTDRKLTTQLPPRRGRLELFDKIVTGLCFRITDKGAKSWSVMYRFNGALRRDTLGRSPKIGLVKARQIARHRLEIASQGKDPREEDVRLLAAEAERKADTVAAVAVKFIERIAKQSRWPELERVLNREIIPAWGDREMRTIRRRDIHELIDSIVDRGSPVQANRVLAIIKRFMAWAVERDIIDASPAELLAEPTRETSRERVLTDAELAALWRASGRIGWPFGPIFQLLMLTGQRRGEISSLRWSDFDLGARLIEIPAARYKTRRHHVVPLSAAAIEIIEDLPRMAGNPLVFSMTGARPVVGFGAAKRRALALMTADLPKSEDDNREPWSIHDIRRTTRTKLSEIGINADVAERVLGHVIGGVRGVYDRYSFLDEKRQALDRWAAALDRIINLPKKGAKVVLIERR